MPKKNNFDILTYKKALDFSYSFYQSKYRKGIKFPYFTYLSSVSNLVIENNGSTEEAVASVNGQEMSGTAIRQALSNKDLSPKERKDIFKQITGFNNPSIEKMLLNKLA